MKRNVYTYEFDKTVVKFVIKLAHVLYSTSLFIWRHFICDFALMAYFWYWYSFWCCWYPNRRLFIAS